MFFSKINYSFFPKSWILKLIMTLEILNYKNSTAILHKFNLKTNRTYIVHICISRNFIRKLDFSWFKWGYLSVSKLWLNFKEKHIKIHENFLVYLTTILWAKLRNFPHFPSSVCTNVSWYALFCCIIICSSGRALCKE